MRRHVRITRDSLLFGAGLALTVYEAIVREGERPYLLALYAGMMGLPAMLGKARSDKDGNDGS